MILLGFLISLLGALGALYKKALSGSGLLGAVIVGTLIAGYGGWLWFGILVIFFITSSFWTDYKREKKREVEKDFAKTSQRDFQQVMANGGIGALAAVLGVYLGNIWHLFPFFIGAMAVVTADTWATEIGVLSRGNTRSIFSGEKVPSGTSGGISILGTLAGTSGAILIGLVAEFGYHFLVYPSLPVGILLSAGFIGGITGCLSDSLLGATLQVHYKCRVCGKITERLKHCHQLTVRAGGIEWINNDLVNLFSSIIGGLIATLVAMFLGFYRY